MVIHTEYLTIKSKKRREILDITEEVERVRAESHTSALVVSVSAMLAIALASSAADAGMCSDGPTSAARKQMYSYMQSGIKESNAGQMAGAEKTWRSAYEYMREHCYEVPTAFVRLLRQGKAVQAFQIFADDNAPPLYEQLGAKQYYDSGLKAAKNGDFESAIANFRSALQIARKSSLGPRTFPEADFMLGMALYAQGKKQEAAAQWRYTLMDSGQAGPDDEGFGPDFPWLSALQMHEIENAPDGGASTHS